MATEVRYTSDISWHHQRFKKALLEYISLSLLVSFNKLIKLVHLKPDKA